MLHTVTDTVSVNTSKTGSLKSLEISRRKKIDNECTWVPVCDKDT